jgi:hypothetical protein
MVQALAMVSLFLSVPESKGIDSIVAVPVKTAIRETIFVIREPMIDTPLVDSQLLRRDIADLVAQQDMARYAFWSILANAFVGLSAVITSILAIRYTRQQAKIEERQIERQILQNEIQQRAYLTVDLVSGPKPIRYMNNPVTQAVAEFRIKNSGLTPAKSITHFSYILVKNASEGEDFSEVIENRGGFDLFSFSLGSGESIITMTQAAHVPFESLIDLENKKAIYVVGSIHYQDIFQRDRYLEFGWRVIPNENEKWTAIKTSKNQKDE